MVVKNTVKHAVGPTCADCGVDSGVAALIWRYGAWYCLDETACAERVFLVSGGADLVRRAQALQATQTPRDGETLGAFRYSASAGAWLYNASYGNDFVSCQRRAISLRDAYGLHFVVYKCGDEVFAGMPDAYTSALRAVVAASPIWPDDEAAHVAETVDELHARPDAPGRE